MKEIRRTVEFDRWLEAVRDDNAVARIQKRIDRLEEGNYGDHKRFEGLIELRIDVGQGYRIYCVERKKILVIILAGGTKSSQERDIRRAIKMAAMI